MEEIVIRLFNLLDTVALTDAEENILKEIEKDYSLAKETMCTIKCLNCGAEIKF